MTTIKLSIDNTSHNINVISDEDGDTVFTVVPDSDNSTTIQADLSADGVITIPFKEFVQLLVTQYEHHNAGEAEAEPVKDIPQQIIPNIFDSQYLPMLNGYPTNDLMAMSKTKMTVDGYTGKATYTKDGRTITILDFDQLQGAIGSSAKKLLDTAIVYLTVTNYYRADRVNPTVTINLADYWKAKGLDIEPKPMDTEEKKEAEQTRIKNYIKYLKNELKADLDNLKSLEWSGQGTGRNKGDFAKYSFISSYRVRGNTLTVNFDIDIAKYLVQAYQMQWSPALLLLDDRDPNSYPIGRKILLHHSTDSNAEAGTNNTLAVISLLKAAPEIQTIEELKAKGRRDWKEKIKKKLENALNKNVTITHILKRWEYRSPRTGTTYTPKTADNLTWEEYSTLMVDFIIADEPDQEARRAAKAAEKKAAIPEKKKRGRPRKNPEK